MQSRIYADSAMCGPALAMIFPAKFLTTPLYGNPEGQVSEMVKISGLIGK